MGAWIEIIKVSIEDTIIRSLPSWERGLKFLQEEPEVLLTIVAPLVGAWIEIGYVICF